MKHRPLLLHVFFITVLVVPFLPCPAPLWAQSLPTSGPVAVEPLTIPAGAAGWGREYTPIAAETFSTLTRIPGKGFMLQQGGRFITDGSGASWALGSSAGEQDYLAYYSSDPATLPLAGGREYELRFAYRIEEAADKGFETIFYSPTAGRKNLWLPGVHIDGKAGDSGTSSFRARLYPESDYRAWWSVIHRGKIAIRGIEIRDVATGKLVARDDLGAAAYGPGPAFACRGSLSEPSPKPGSISLGGLATLRTVPSALPLQPDTVYILEFSWRVRRRNPNNPAILGNVTLFAASDEAHRRIGKRIDGGGADQGRYTGGVQTASAAAPYVLEIALSPGVEMAISDLRILRQQAVPRSAEQNPGIKLARAPFPRLGNYQLGLPDWIAWDGNSSVKENLPLMSTAELDRRLAMYDVVAGIAGSATSLDPAAALRWRTLNPDIVVLPYTIAHEPSKAQFLIDQFSNPLADIDVEFARGIDKAWLLRFSNGTVAVDPDYSWLAKANISPSCPKDTQGRDYIDYFIQKTADLWLKNGTWDGIFIDNLFAQRNFHILNAFNPGKFDADYNLNGRRDETIPWVHEMTARASIRMLRGLRERFGDAEMIIGNAGAYPELLLAPYVNGYIFEWFNFPWYQVNLPGGFSEARWGEVLSNYRWMEATLRRPAAIIMEAIGETTHQTVQPGRSYREPTARDIRIQRIALGTALLGDGFYEFDLFDNLCAPVFFDEWLVGPDGASVDTAAGKGWLGQAMGPAVELIADEQVIRENPRTVRIGKEAGRELRMDCGVNPSDAPRQYVLEFDWRVEETLQFPAEVGYEIGQGGYDGGPINGVVAGTSGHTRVHVTIPGKRHVSIVIRVLDVGALSVKNLKITSARCGVYRRDFENGVVFVNATNEPRTLDARDLAGTFNRTGLKRIAGRLDREVNNGQPVRGSLALPAADAVVLLAARQ